MCCSARFVVAYPFGVAASVVFAKMPHGCSTSLHFKERSNGLDEKCLFRKHIRILTDLWGRENVIAVGALVAQKRANGVKRHLSIKH